MASLEQLVAARVRQARKRADFTLEQLAQKIGVETTTLSRYERGLRALNLEMLERVAKARGVSIGSLVDDGKPGGAAVTDEDELLTTYRTLSPRQRRTVRWLIRHLREVK